MAELYKNKYRIPSARATWHNYNEGMYFITICIKDMKHLFGEIKDDKINLSELGKHTTLCIEKINKIHPETAVHLSVVMPNHLHLLIEIAEISNTKGSTDSPSNEHLSNIIKQFKRAVTNYAKEQQLPFSWQTRFHEHIIRNSGEMNRIADYIENNVLKWASDKFYTE